MIEQVLKYKEEYLDEIKKIRDLKKNGVKLVLFGCGSTSEYIVDKLCIEYGICPDYFVDNDPDKKIIWGGSICDIPIVEYRELCMMKDDVYIYITTQLYYSKIYKQLIYDEFADEMISRYDIIPQFGWEVDYYKFVEDNLKDIEELYVELADKSSKDVLLYRLSFLITRRREFAVKARSIGNHIQYFDDSVIDIDLIETVIDLGAYIGDSALEYIKQRGGKGYKTIYEFEPNDRYFRLAKENLRKNNNIVFIKKGTSNRNEKARVESSLGVMGSIETSLFSKRNDNDLISTEYDICVLDDEFKNRAEKIDFIKMDIEGAEISTLLGSKSIIQTDTPAIAVCVYHKSDDIFRIPHIIKEYNANYKFFLRHYSDNQTETVLYAVI